MHKPCTNHTQPDIYRYVSGQMAIFTESGPNLGQWCDSVVIMLLIRACIIIRPGPKHVNQICYRADFYPITGLIQISVFGCVSTCVHTPYMDTNRNLSHDTVDCRSIIHQGNRLMLSSGWQYTIWDSWLSKHGQLICNPLYKHIITYYNHSHKALLDNQISGEERCSV